MLLGSEAEVDGEREVEFDGSGAAEEVENVDSADVDAGELVELDEEDALVVAWAVVLASAVVLVISVLDRVNDDDIVERLPVVCVCVSLGRGADSETDEVEALDEVGS